jgi:hypothetical protein
LSEWWSAAAERLKKSDGLRILHQLGVDLAPGFHRTSLWPVAFVAVLIAIDSPMPWPHDFPSELFPTAMVQQNVQLVSTGKLLTTDQWGDYIIYHFYPRQRVFVDGRSDFYGEAFADQYLHLLQGAYDWREIMRRNGFTVALLPAGWPLASLLKQDSCWRVVADDHRSVLLLRLSR